MPKKQLKPAYRTGRPINPKNALPTVQAGLQKTKLIHVDPSIHFKFKRFCLSNNKSMQYLAEKALKDFMKSPEIV